MHNGPGIAPPEEALRPRAWRPGIAWQLGVAFVGVALLAAVANFAVQRTISITTTRVLPGEAATLRAPSLHRVPAPPPMPPAAPVASVSEDGRAAPLLLERLTDTVLAGSGLPVQERTQRTSDAASQLRDMLARLHRSPSHVEAARRAGEHLIESEAARRKAFEEHVEVMAELGDRFQAARRSLKSWIRTSQALAQAEQLFQDLRQQSRVLRDDEYTAPELGQLAALEAQFGAMLVSEERALVRAAGSLWHARTSADLELLRALRGRILQLDAQRAEVRPQFEKSVASLRAELLRPAMARRGNAARTADPKVEVAVPPPLIATPPWELGSFRTHEQAVDEGIAPSGLAWLSGGVLALLLLVSVVTVRSILRPVQRLVAATQRIAQGETGVRVAREGSREMDRLATAFNRMAAELETAQAVARNYQQRLEARVVERTRQLQYQADHDSLTQLPNRRQLFEQLRSALARCSQGEGRAGLFFIDLDNFKTINDGRGHGFGDRVLVAVAERLAATMNGRGMAARFGGDEFVVLVEAQDGVQQLGEAGTSLVQAFHRPLHLDGRELLVSVSVGAAFYPEHATGAESLLSAADAALFRAKAMGRSQLAVFTPELLEDAAARFTTEQALRHAVERGELELLFQPEVDLARLEVGVCEALLRWRQPDDKLLGPEHFLRIAEESGLIVEINDWVLRAAIAAAARWHRQGHARLRVAVNATSRQLSDPEFARRVAGLLLEHEVPPCLLEIELTETVLQTGSSTIAGLRRLHEIGVTVALDDFGTGYSSLASLEQLPLHRVKLDRSLIAGIDSSARSAAIANAIIQLCFDLGVQVTAEGVERPEQLAALRDSGITLQGFLLARPLAEAQVDEAVRRLPELLQSLLLATTPATNLAGAHVPASAVASRQRRRLSAIRTR